MVTKNELAARGLTVYYRWAIGDLNEDSGWFVMEAFFECLKRLDEAAAALVFKAGAAKRDFPQTVAEKYRVPNQP